MSKKQFSLGPTEAKIVERFRTMKSDYSFSVGGGVTNERFISFLMDTADGKVQAMSDTRREARKTGLTGVKKAVAEPEEPENDEQEINLDALEGLTDEEVEAYLRGEKTGNQEN